MTSSKVDWKTNVNLAVGKGAAVHEIVANVGSDKLKIDVAPWGEGHFIGKSLASTMPKTGATLFVNSRRLPIAISKVSHSNQRARGSPP